MFTTLILKRAAVRQTTASRTDASWQLTDEQWFLIADLLEPPPPEDGRGPMPEPVSKESSGFSGQEPHGKKQSRSPSDERGDKTGCGSLLFQNLFPHPPPAGDG